MAQWNKVVCLSDKSLTRVFESVVTVAFQNVFCSKMYQNNIYFYFKKIIFNISISKWSENTKKILIWNKEKIRKKNYFFLKILLKRKNKQSNKEWGSKGWLFAYMLALWKLNRPENLIFSNSYS
jgi:hypothetical protein